jgi:hypothetical protein
MSNTTETRTHTDTPSPIDHQAIVDDYFAAWNTTDPAVRQATIAALYTPDAHVSDPLVDVTGHEQLSELFVRFHETYAGCSFRQKGTIDAHHDLMRWGWEMIDADGNVMLDGLDVGLVGANGKLGYVAGFFGLQLPGT